MFNDKYGLTEAVLKGLKTMTRRAVTRELLECIRQYSHGDEEELRYRLIANAPYKVGEIVAVAQRYSDIFTDPYHIGLYGRTAGWNNKMFVNAIEMPHHIEMLNYHVEHMQDISDEDCMKEGVLYSNDYTLPYYIPEKYSNVFFGYRSPREAFAALVDKVSGRGKWKSNLIVYAYTYKLID